MIKVLFERWWFLLLLVLVFFLPPLSQIEFTAVDTPAVIKEVLIAPYVYRFPELFVVSKLIFIGLAVGLATRPRLFWRPFATFAALLLLVVAVFQNIADTASYGLTVLTGNLLLMLIVAGLWAWEAITPGSQLAAPDMKRQLVLPLAILAFWMPVDSVTGSQNLVLAKFLTSESLLTFCMLIPILLAVLILYYPNVNRTLLRGTAFIGIVFGITNMLTWFVLDRGFLWMGIVHLPLLINSLLGFNLTRPKKKKKRRAA
ncbi:MAG: hypothetical protein FH749_02875 [Firmicutes bacterium]|nr:hypothetical protein [Bacillota bacterium]